MICFPDQAGGLWEGLLQEPPQHAVNGSCPWRWMPLHQSLARPEAGPSKWESAPLFGRGSPLLRQQCSWYHQACAHWVLVEPLFSVGTGQHAEKMQNAVKATDKLLQRSNTGHYIYSRLVNYIARPWKWHVWMFIIKPRKPRVSNVICSFRLLNVINPYHKSAQRLNRDFIKITRLKWGYSSLQTDYYKKLYRCNVHNVPLTFMNPDPSANWSH